MSTLKKPILTFLIISTTCSALNTQCSFFENLKHQFGCTFDFEKKLFSLFCKTTINSETENSNDLEFSFLSSLNCLLRDKYIYSEPDALCGECLSSYVEDKIENPNSYLKFEPKISKRLNKNVTLSTKIPIKLLENEKYSIGVHPSIKKTNDNKTVKLKGSFMYEAQGDHYKLCNEFFSTINCKVSTKNESFKLAGKLSAKCNGNTILGIIPTNKNIYQNQALNLYLLGSKGDFKNKGLNVVIKNNWRFDILAHTNKMYFNKEAADNTKKISFFLYGLVSLIPKHLLFNELKELRQTLNQNSINSTNN